MNSRQRRVDRRRYQHEIVLLCKDYNHFVRMWKWLDKRYGRIIHQCGWRYRHLGVEPDFFDEEFEVVWQFTRKNRAVEFKLLWA